MKLKWNGHACFTLTTDSGITIVTDPFDASVGYPRPKDRADIVTISHSHHDHNDMSSLTGPKLALDKEGEYRQGDVRIRAMASYHDDNNGAKRGDNLLFRIEADGVSVAHLGDLGHLPTPEQTRFLSDATVMLIPIGGFYTIDTEQALEIIAKARPKTAIPMHYKTHYIAFPISDEAQFEKATRAKRVEAAEIELNELPPAVILSV